MLRSANEAVQTLLLPKYQDALLTTGDKQVGELESRVKQLQAQFDDIAYMKFTFRYLQNNNLVFSKMAAKKLKDLTVVEASLKGEGGGDVVSKAQGKVIIGFFFKTWS